jgi:sugar lactone lactonase YvrE
MMSMSNRGWKHRTLAGLRCTAILGIVASMGAAMQAQSVRIVPSATKVAGTGLHGFNSDFGTASSVELNAPSSNTFDSQGNQYISDAGNNCVRKVDTSGNISTVAGLDQAGPADTCNSSLNSHPTAAQGLLNPNGVAVDQSGNLYVADTGHNCVRRLGSGSTGVATMVTVVGSCSGASLSPSPTGLELDAAGNLYVSTQDSVNGINQVLKHRVGDPATTVCRVAGAASLLVPTACGAGAVPTLSKPSGLAFDPIGDLFIADTGNVCLREMTPAGVFSTPVGQCTNDGSGTAVTGLTSPTGLAFSEAGRLYITNPGTSNVFEFLMTGQLNLIAGLASGASGPYAPSQDGTAAVSVPLTAPIGIAVDPLGTPFVVDSQNNVVRELASNNRFPGTAVNNSSPAQSAFFVITAPVKITASAGTDYKIVGNTCNGSLTPSSTATPTTCSVSMEFLPQYPGSRRSPLTFTDATSGSKFTWGLSGIGLGADAIFPPGTMSTLLSTLANPSSVRLNSAGDVYFAESGTSGDGDVKIIPAGSTTPNTLIAPGAGLNTPTAIALDSAGNLYIADKGLGKVMVYGANGSLTPLISGLDDPEALAIDSFDNLFIATAGATPAIIEVYAGGQQSVIAGQGPISNANGVPAVAAKFIQPGGLAVDSNGVIYVSDRKAFRVYSIDTFRYIHYLVGNGTTTDSAPGTALGTALQDPRDLAVDAAGDVYIADGTGNSSIVVYSSTQQNPAVSTIAGTGTPGDSGDGGPATSALLKNPVSIALDGKTDVYIVDLGNQALRKITYTYPTLDFGTINVGDISAAQTATIWDTGNLNLTQIAALQLSDTVNFEMDTDSTQCGTTVLAGATCDYGFRCTPQTVGSFSATATLTDNSYTATQVINLKCNAKNPNTGGTAPSTIGTAPYTGVYGHPYTWSASVTGDGTHTPTGTLTFTINGVQLCPPVAINGAGQASCSPLPTGLDVGTYPMTISYSGDGFYAVNSVAATATITPAPVTITANNASRGYGQPNPAFTGTITGVVAGESITATYSTTATLYSPPGQYPITPVAVAGPNTKLSNYAITIVNGILTITQAGPVTITVNNATRIYGVPNPTFTSTITNGANGDTITVTYSTTATLTSPPGNYPITAQLSGASSGNYSGATVVPGVLTVTKAPTTLALTSSNPTQVPNAPITFTAIVTSTSQIIPDGVVTFADGGTPIGTGTLDANGHATFTTSSLAVGSHTITATYPGTIDFLPSTASIPQGIAVPGSFTITATPPYQEIKGAGTSTYQITVTSVDGFFGPVNLSCAGLPADAGCAYSPATVTLTAGGTATTTLTTTTTLNDAKPPTTATKLPPPGGSGMMPLLAWTMFPMQLSGAATLLAGGLRRRKKESLWKRLLFLIPLVLLIVGISGCGCTVTQFATYPITITGSATSIGTPLTETTTVTLSVIQ